MGIGVGMTQGNQSNNQRNTKAAKEKLQAQQMKSAKRQRQAAAAGARDSGLTSSLAFTPVQGIELANPNREAKKPAEVGEKYFATGAAFRNIQRR